jgi:putative AbiEi antitoxin of type IV toxin-antitoxin system
VRRTRRVITVAAAVRRVQEVLARLGPEEARDVLERVRSRHPPDRLTPASEAVVKYARFSSPFTPREFAIASGVSPAAAAMAVSRALRAGSLRRVSPGLYALANP